MSIARSIAGFAVCFLAVHGAAQDIHFGQFYNAPLVINPASAGDIEGDQRFALIHREQWRSVGSPFRTDAFSYDVPVFRGRLNGRYLGVGINAYSDKAGSTRFGDTQANLSLSYAIRSGADGRAGAPPKRGRP